jgi:hypothetical protein
MKIPVVGLYLLFSGSALLYGQAVPTASRTFDLQVGGGFVLDHSDYEVRLFRGGAIYSTLDFSSHFGAEIDFHQANSSVDKAYERTYEVGARYHRNYGRFEPYGKVLYGRGVYNFVVDSYNANGSISGSTVVANLAYNEIVFGGGTDFRVLPYLNVRADYEYQMWHSFPSNGLTPQLFEIGVAYHFPGGLQKGLHWR